MGLAAERRWDAGLVNPNHNARTPPGFFISVASKGLRVSISPSESTLANSGIGIDSK